MKARMSGRLWSWKEVEGVQRSNADGKLFKWNRREEGELASMIEGTVKQEREETTRDDEVYGEVREAGA